MSTTTDRPALTPRQQDVLQWITGYIDGHDYGPTVREIAHHYGWTVNGANCHLRVLRRKNYITWIDGQTRTIRIVRGDA